MSDLLFRIRYTFHGAKFFGYRTAWEFSLSWVNGELDRDGCSPRDAVIEDVEAAL